MQKRILSIFLVSCVIVYFFYILFLYTIFIYCFYIVFGLVLLDFFKGMLLSSFQRPMRVHANKGKKGGILLNDKRKILGWCAGGGRIHSSDDFQQEGRNTFQVGKFL